jgi:Protein of unknown function (DUF1402)
MSNLSPTEKRKDPDVEAQRVEAINLVRQRRDTIKKAAVDYDVPAEAIAGAILWEGIENPYHRSFGRLGPGKVHPGEFWEKSEAEKVEIEGRVTPPAKSVSERSQRLMDPEWAIVYIAAIMDRHADNYQKIANENVRKDPAVLCTLYQGGHSEDRAKRFAERRKADPKAHPVAADEMGPWVQRWLPFIRTLLANGVYRP